MAVAATSILKFQQAIAFNWISIWPIILTAPTTEDGRAPFLPMKITCKLTFRPEKRIFTKFVCSSKTIMESWDISVLVVEDEKILRTIYQKLLTDKFKQLDFAENGLEGFEKYQALQPDLVITDIKMPLMNGLDMVRKIRRINPDARIIIMSAYGESHYFLRAIENGVKGFLLKPVDHSKLLQVTKEQAQEILLRKSILEEERKRKLAEEALRRNEAILQAVSDAAEILLSEGYNDFSVQKVLAKLGSATQVNRVYFFENYELNDTLYTQQK